MSHHSYNICWLRWEDHIDLLFSRHPVQNVVFNSLYSLALEETPPRGPVRDVRGVLEGVALPRHLLPDCLKVKGAAELLSRPGVLSLASLPGAASSAGPPG